MSAELRDKLIFHGAIVMLLGLFAGFPFAMVLLGSMDGEPRAWRMAHLEGVLNGLLLVAIAGVGRRLDLGKRQQQALAWSLIVMAYGNAIASSLGASFGVRGLSPVGPAANVLVYTLFLIAVVGVFAAIALVAWGVRGTVQPARASGIGVTRPHERAPVAPTESGDPPRRRRRRRRGGRGRGPARESPPAE